jgi:hypothetical protein
VDVRRGLVQPDRVARHRAGDGALDVAALHVGHDVGEAGLHRHAAQRLDRSACGGLEVRMRRVARSARLAKGLLQNTTCAG